MTVEGEKIVSIIVPVYNAAHFLSHTISMVQAQTYKNWELIFIDDCSHDNSVEIIESLNDKRIKLIVLKENSGPAVARNVGVNIATGSYVAFLDADDLWSSRKLERQLQYMSEVDAAFCFASYEFATSEGVRTGKIAYAPVSLTYTEALKNTTIFTSTVMFNLGKIDRKMLQMPTVGSEDTALWWRILRSGVVGYGFQENHVAYRRSPGTLSANKLTAIRRTWNLYRQQESLGLLSASYYFCHYIVNATARRI